MRPKIPQATADASSSSRLRYNVLVEDREARHIGDIIRERDNAFWRRGGDLSAPSRAARRTLRIQKLFCSLLGVVLDVLATIGWFVTLPFITQDDRAQSPCEQSRG
jgi:hypothetical protein